MGYWLCNRSSGWRYALSTITKVPLCLPRPQRLLIRRLPVPAAMSRVPHLEYILGNLLRMLYDRNTQAEEAKEEQQLSET